MVYYGCSGYIFSMRGEILIERRKVYGGRVTGTVTQLQQPEGEMAGRRMGMLVLLVVLLPPLGILFSLKSIYTTIRDKLIFTAISACSMLVMLCIIMGGRADKIILPDPVPPRSVGYTAATPAPAAPGAAAPADASREAAAQSAPTAPLSDSIIVYSVKYNAAMYHSADVCNGQSNRRSLTLTAALAEGLSPCPQCVVNGR